MFYHIYKNYKVSCHLKSWLILLRVVCRGLYVACVFYKDDNIVVTAEEQLPIIEVDDSYSSLTQDFLWFTKVR